jgi:hypothetical protein
MFVQDGYWPDRYFLGSITEFTRGNRMLYRIPGKVPIMTLAIADSQQISASGLELRSILSKGPVEPSTENRAEEKIPRPPNAYILYRKDRHHLVKDANPGISNNEICK